MKPQGNAFPYPPVIKQKRVGCFTGKCGEEDSEVWLADFHEATADCKWTDTENTMVLLVFVRCCQESVPDREHFKKENKSWTDIVRTYKGHYGVNMEPRTAYLHCHELRFEDFASEQGLLGLPKKGTKPADR